MLVYIK
ncbi:hypothetical protein S40293_11587, partial [Stachybotrys chartarum IBT 40293]